MPREIPWELVDAGAERIDDLLLQLGVDPTYAPEHAPTATVKRTLAQAVLGAVSDAAWLRRDKMTAEVKAQNGWAHDMIRERDEARAQAEAFAEVVADLIEVKNDWPTTFHPNGGPGWREAFANGHDALRAYRESQEPDRAA